MRASDAGGMGGANEHSFVSCFPYAFLIMAHQDDGDN
jgi:hypothetical protein